MPRPQSKLLYWFPHLSGRSAETDAALLGCYIERDDGDAFAELVRRHGPMVLAVCRRVLPRPEDADDAFQATFLVLAQRAATLRRPETLAAWLHRTAHRMALQVRRAESRRQRHEGQATRPAPADPLAEVSARELLTVLDEELQRLPASYRLPLLLCCLQGRSQEEAAQQLGWTPGSLKGRLERGREQLQARLVRRGFTLPAVLLASEVSHAVAAVPHARIAALLQAAVAFTVGRSAAKGMISEHVLALTEGGIKSMIAAKVRFAVLVAAAMTTLSLGGGVIALQATQDKTGKSVPGPAGPQVVVQAEQPPKPKAEPSTGKAEKNEQAAVLPRYLIYPVTTALQRELIRPPADLFVVVDSTEALQDGNIVPTGLPLEDLRKALGKPSNRKTSLYVSVFFADAQPRPAGAPNLLCLALAGFGYRLGFAKVEAHGNFPGTGSTTWAEHAGKWARRKTERPPGEEQPKSDPAVLVYPVRTELSRYLSSDADCVVVLRTPLRKGHTKVPDQVLETTRKAIAELKLSQTRKVYIVAQRIDYTEESFNPLLDGLRQFGRQLGFDDFSILL